MNKVCPRCGKCKNIKDFYMTHSYCKQCVNEQTLERQRKLKADAVALLGGKCTICKGVFHNAAFEFHHPDPDGKDYSIGNKKCLRIESHTQELAKCVLVCSNCHKTIHAKY